MDEYRFVPDVVWAWFICLFPDGHMLQRLLSRGLVSTWEGWRHFDKRCMSDHVNVCVELWVDHLIQEFLSISMEHVVVNCVTDEKRRQ